jgi:hypothetical protein
VTTLDGNPIFGYAVRVQHTPHPNSQQINEFFGVNGLQTLFGGTRGRTFLISGVLSAPDIPILNAVEATLLSYADGLPHTLVDNRGRTWFNVIFGGVYVPCATGPCPVANGGWCLPYRLVMTGLT